MKKDRRGASLVHFLLPESGPQALLKSVGALGTVCPNLSSCLPLPSLRQQSPFIQINGQKEFLLA